MATRFGASKRLNVEVDLAGDEDDERMTSQNVWTRMVHDGSPGATEVRGKNEPIVTVAPGKRWNSRIRSGTSIRIHHQQHTRRGRDF